MGGRRSEYTYSLHLLALRSLDVLGDPSGNGKRDQHGRQTDQRTMAGPFNPHTETRKSDARTSIREADTGKSCRA